MNKNELSEREITLYDLFWNIILQWRWIVGGVLLGAILISGIKYLKDFTEYNSSPTVLDIEDLEQVEGTLDYQQRNDLKSAEDIQELINQKQQYLKESVLMNQNPYKQKVLTFEYYIDTDYKFNYTKETMADFKSELVSGYADFIESGNLAQSIVDREKIEIDIRYMQELISVQRSENGMLRINVAYQEKSDSIIEIIKNDMESLQKNLKTQIGEHSLSLISVVDKQIVNRDLALQQKDEQDRLSNLKVQLNTIKATFNEEQIVLFEYFIQEEVGEEYIQQKTEPELSLKVVLVGAILGIFFVCACVVLKILYTAKLQKSEEITKIYGIRLLGEITEDSKNRKLLWAIDRLLYMIRNRRRKVLNHEQQKQMILSNIEITCEKENIKEIYVTGSEMETISVELLEQWANILKQKKITVKWGNSINYDAKSLRSMSATGHVIFLERVNVSKYREIENELRMANEQKIDIIGSIVWNSVFGR